MSSLNHSLWIFPSCYTHLRGKHFSLNYPFTLCFSSETVFLRGGTISLISVHWAECLVHQEAQHTFLSCHTERLHLVTAIIGTSPDPTGCRHDKLRAPLVLWALSHSCGFHRLEILYLSLRKKSRREHGKKSCWAGSSLSQQLPRAPLKAVSSTQHTSRETWPCARHWEHQEVRGGTSGAVTTPT